MRGGELTYGDGEIGMLLYNNTSHAVERKVVWCRFAKKNWLSYAVRVFSLEEIKGRALLADAWLGIKGSLADGRKSLRRLAICALEAARKFVEVLNVSESH